MSDTFAPGVFEGTTAVVTGGGTGIGRAIALGFARLGGDVVIASRDPEHLAATADEIRSLGVECLDQPVNIRDTESVDSLLEAVTERLGTIHHLVNNAGGQFPAAPGDISDNGWRSVVDLNLNGTWNMISRFAPDMVAAGRGSIVNIIHNFSFEMGGPMFVHSGASRAGVLNLTRSLASTMAKAQVTVNAVSPGTVDTSGMHDNEGDALAELTDFDVDDATASLAPMRRMGRPDEIADPVLFLCSPAARYVSGIAMHVGGADHLMQPVDFFPDRAW